MRTIAIALYVLFVLVALVLRTVLQRRRTGRSGFVGLRKRAGATDWVAAVGFVASLVGVPIGLALGPPTSSLALTVVGIALAGLGILGVAWSQQTMGASFRIGVDEDETLTLVTAGPFRLVRNPIFSSMALLALGLVALVPGAITIVASLCGLLAIELQVRYVEEPCLLRTQGHAYERYAAATGRFVPGVGRLHATVHHAAGMPR